MSRQRHIHADSSLWDVVHRLLDAASIVASLAAVVRAAQVESSEAQLAAGAAAVVIYFLVAEISGMYRSWRGVTTEREITCATLTWIYTVPVLMTIAYLSDRMAILPRDATMVWFFTAPLSIAACRIFIRLVQHGLRERGLNTRGCAIVGVTELGFNLARNVEANPNLGLKIVGFFDDRPSERTPDMPSDVGHRLGNISELVKEAQAGRVTQIYITLPLRAEDRVKEVLNQLADTTASVYIVPDFFVFELLHSRWTNIGGLPVVSVFDNPFYGVDGLVKRAADLVLATLFLTIAAVPMMLVALAIKLTSSGPVFFRQKRYGLDGREIRVWKFRTMKVCEDGATVTQATRNDDRVTRIGRLLRRTSIDELPQLFNVIDGSMSLVGPRPHASTHNEQFRKMIQGYMLRHKVKPGITGLAQVNGWRGETDTLYKMKKRVEFDHQYIREWSPWGDIKILVKTVFTAFSSPNAF